MEQWGIVHRPKLIWNEAVKKEKPVDTKSGQGA